MFATANSYGGEQYNRKLADLLAVQNEIAREVSQRLRSQLSAEDQQKLSKGLTDNPEAYQLYLKGKYYTNKFTREGFRKGIDYFNQAIALDPNYGLAYNGLAYNYINQDDWFIRPSEAAPRAKDSAKKALAIDESDADAHLSLAIVAHWYEWDWAAAEREFQRAIELNPKTRTSTDTIPGTWRPWGEMTKPSRKRSTDSKPTRSRC
jgi:tetratricopeptide (TPR) repeat protein